jgi:hypothetical protein
MTGDWLARAALAWLMLVACGSAYLFVSALWK